MDVHEDTGWQPRKNIVDDDIDIAARHQYVARIHDEKISPAQRVKCSRIGTLDWRANNVYRQVRDRRARRWIDRGIGMVFLLIAALVLAELLGTEL